MAVERVHITARVPFAPDTPVRPRLAEAGFERIDALVEYAVDPDHPANAVVTDLRLAPRDADGLVRFSGDATLVRPARSNGGVLLDVPNRGHRVAPRMFHAAESEDDNDIQPGRPMLFERGYAMAFCGWQWDVPREDGRMGLAAPLIADCDGEMQLRYQVSWTVPHLPLTDQHVGEVGNHQPIPPEPQLVGRARLLVRDTPYGAPTELPRSGWDFAVAGADGRPVASTSHVWVEGGFQPGLVYDLVYTPAACPVVGAGMLALRDFASHLKRGSEPFGVFSHVVGEGVSQCGRLLRTCLYHGVNVDEAGERAFDGLLIHVAGGRRGEFNQRYGQPSVQPTPGFGHLPPYADRPTVDGGSGLLDALDGEALPKIFYTDTSAEYWRGDASLTHIASDGRADLELPPNVRRFLLASTQHGAGIVPPVDTAFASRGANLFNVVDYRPLMRALLIRLFDWVMHDAEPPGSEIPRVDDGSAISRAKALDQLAGVQGLALPHLAGLNSIRPLDLGPRMGAGIGTFPAAVAGAPLEARVARLDEDGNETSGLVMPDVRVPVGTHTGFNPRHPETGGRGQLVAYVGSSRFFGREELKRRYGTRRTYLEAVERAARAAVDRGQLLDEDVGWCVKLASDRFDAAMGEQQS